MRNLVFRLVLNHPGSGCRTSRRLEACPLLIHLKNLPHKRTRLHGVITFLQLACSRYSYERGKEAMGIQGERVLLCCNARRQPKRYNALIKHFTLHHPGPMQTENCRPAFHLRSGIHTPGFCAIALSHQSFPTPV
jgi:hypothetical protein